MSCEITGLMSDSAWRQYCMRQWGDVPAHSSIPLDSKQDTPFEYTLMADDEWIEFVANGFNRPSASTSHVQPTLYAKREKPLQKRRRINAGRCDNISTCPACFHQMNKRSCGQCLSCTNKGIRKQKCIAWRCHIELQNKSICGITSGLDSSYLSRIPIIGDRFRSKWSIDGENTAYFDGTSVEIYTAYVFADNEFHAVDPLLEESPVQGLYKRGIDFDGKILYGMNSGIYIVGVQYEKENITRYEIINTTRFGKSWRFECGVWTTDNDYRPIPTGIIERWFQEKISLTMLDDTRYSSN